MPQWAVRYDILKAHHDRTYLALHSAASTTVHTTALARPADPVADSGVLASGRVPFWPRAEPERSLQVLYISPGLAMIKSGAVTPPWRVSWYYLSTAGTRGVFFAVIAAFFESIFTD